MHQSYLTHGSLVTPDPAECALNKHLIELAIWLHAELKREHLRVLAALPILAKDPWQIAPVVKIPSLLNKAQSSGEDDLRRFAPSARIEVASHLKYRLFDTVDDLTRFDMRLAWNDAHLFLLITMPDDKRSDFQKATGISFTFITLQEQPSPDKSCSHEPEQKTTSLEIKLPGEQKRPDGYLIRIAWQDTGVTSPVPGKEFGLGISIKDAKEGEIEMPAFHEAYRARLA
ncbi:MAG: hypothetical protein C4555_01890 [Dehalococcoidia bacterium]|nr:MAG: hypothetical protein C4555_01890 [Dehalococcoidia bacterium]